MTERATQLFKCLADETRLAILLLTQAEGELCVCELTHALAVSQPKISRHLAQLRNCELVIDRRQGQWVHYRLHPQLPDWAQAILANTAQACASDLAMMQRSLASMGSRPTRQRDCC